jgi:hypothetical protein
MRVFGNRRLALAVCTVLYCTTAVLLLRMFVTRPCIKPCAAVFLDVSQNGKLLTPAACRSRYPNLTGLLQQHQHGLQQPAAVASDSSQIGWLPPEAAPAVDTHQPGAIQGAVLQPPGVVAVWASLVRSMVTAHQRRGESDLVAQWLYQLLALDTQAVEWAHVLR